MSIADALAQTYLDSCDVFRFESQKVNGITKSQKVLKYQGIKCALSQSSLSKIVKSDVAEVSTSQKLFTRPEVDIQEGDILHITKQCASIFKIYTAGEIFPYADSHIEIKVSRSDKV